MKNEISISLTLLVLTACGGGGGSSTNGDGGSSNGVTQNLQITPSLGRFTSGTVKLIKADGTTVATASITNGAANISSGIGCVPAIIEVSNGTFYDEGRDQVVSMGDAPLRAAVSCFSDQSTMTVTALTELAYRKLGSNRDGQSIDNANKYVKEKYAADLSSILKPPTLIGSISDAKSIGSTSTTPREPDMHAIRLAAFSVMAKAKSVATMTLIQQAGENIAQTGTIDNAGGSTSQTGSLSGDYINAIMEYTSDVATYMIPYSLLVVASTDYPIMQSSDFAQLMRLFATIPKESRYILTQDNPNFEVPAKGFYHLPCNLASLPGDGSAEYKDCSSNDFGVLPYRSVFKMSGSTSAVNIPSSQVNGYRYAQRVTANLTYSEGTKNLNVALNGDDMKAFTGDYPGILPDIWPTGMAACTMFDMRNATLTIGDGSSAMNLFNVDACAYDDWGTVAPDAPYLDTKYAIRGISADGRTFSNQDTPLVFRRPGVLVDLRTPQGALLVGGKLSLPTTPNRSISIEPYDATGTAARITVTTISAGVASTETAKVPMAKILQHAVY